MAFLLCAREATRDLNNHTASPIASHWSPYVFVVTIAVSVLRSTLSLPLISSRARGLMHKHYLTAAVCLRVINVVHMFNILVALQVHCGTLSRYDGWVRALSTDIASIWLLFPFIANLPFRYHVVFAIPELLLTWCGMASILGYVLHTYAGEHAHEHTLTITTLYSVCGTMQVLLGPRACVHSLVPPIPSINSTVPLYNAVFTADTACGYAHPLAPGTLAAVPKLLEALVRLTVRYVCLTTILAG